MLRPRYWLVLASAGCGWLVDTSDLSGARDANDASAANDAAIGPDVEGTSGDGAAPSDASPTDGGSNLDAAADAVPIDAGRAYAAAVLADQPLMYLPFGESAGSTQAHDLTGRFTPATIGTPTFGRPGAIANDPDTAVLLAQDGFDCGPVFDFSGVQQFTIELWARVPGDVQVNDPRFLVRKGDFVGDASAPEAYSLFFAGLSGSSNANLVFSRRVSAMTLTTDTPVDPSITKFRHLVATYVSNTLQLYVDANLFGSDSDGRLGNANTGSFLIGLRQGNLGFARTEIDELAVYDKPLSAARIKAHYDIGSGLGPEP